MSFLVVTSAFSGVNSYAAQQAWVTHYNSGPGTTNQAVAMALDKDGNIYVAGHSTRTNAPYDYDYVLIKYNALGIQQWVSRYGAAGVNDQVRAMVANTNGEVFVTGTTETLRYLSNGSLTWNAPYGGRDITIDANDNCYVTGFLTNDFSTVKIAPSGSNVWLRTWDYTNRQDFSQRIALDGSGNVFVAGLAVWFCDRLGCYPEPVIIKYDSSGAFLWDRHPARLQHFFTSEFKRLACNEQGDLYAAVNLRGYCCSWDVWKLRSDGEFIGEAESLPDTVSGEGIIAMALDRHMNVYATGQLPDGFIPSYKLTKDFTNIWEAHYQGPVVGFQEGRAIAPDNAGNAYVTGPSTGVGTGLDYVTIKYDANGGQEWVKRYTEAGNSEDRSIGVAVSQSGDVYVTGFSNPTNGLYEITTIKYVQVAPIEKKSNGNVLLQFCGAPGSNYVIQATTDFPNWSVIGNTTADSTGIYRFEDTNAPSYPNRFYRVEP